MSHSATELFETPLADIVTADPRTAMVFDQLGLDYCCRGHETLGAAVRRQGLIPESVASQIEALGSGRASDSLNDQWPDLAALVEHIVNTHHRYVREIHPVVATWLDKLVDRHGQRHPELAQLRDEFAGMAAELTAHMIKEERILFPHIMLLARRSPEDPPVSSPFGSLQNPIRAMEHEHLSAGKAFERMRGFTQSFTLPDDACHTYELCYQELDRFERDLHRHVHLEEHILFPRAVLLEQSAA